MLVEQVIAIALDHELVVLVILAHANFVPDGDIGLQKWIRAGTRYNTIFDDVGGGGITMQFRKVAASFSPLACG